jgi:hypothetical protein
MSSVLTAESDHRSIQEIAFQDRRARESLLAASRMYGDHLPILPVELTIELANPRYQLLSRPDDHSRDVDNRLTISAGNTLMRGTDGLHPITSLEGQEGVVVAAMAHSMRRRVPTSTEAARTGISVLQSGLMDSLAELGEGRWSMDEFDVMAPSQLDGRTWFAGSRDPPYYSVEMSVHDNRPSPAICKEPAYREDQPASYYEPPFDENDDTTWAAVGRDERL